MKHYNHMMHVEYRRISFTTDSYIQNKDDKLFFEFVPEGDLFLFNISSFQSFVSFVIK